MTFGINGGRRFIENEAPWISYEGECEQCSLLFASTETAPRGIRHAAKTKAVEQIGGGTRVVVVGRSEFKNSTRRDGRPYATALQERSD